MKSLFLATAIAGMGFAAHADTWLADPTHTEVVVSWNHVGLSTQSAEFFGVDGALILDLDDVESARAEFTVSMDTVFTGLEMLDGELVGAGFFDAANFPVASFVSTSVEQTGENTAKVTGDLTIRDQTQEVVWDVVGNVTDAHPVGQFIESYKGTWMGFTATTTIKRSEFGIATMIGIGSDEIEITINSELKNQEDGAVAE